jgi:hypothetical protein
MVFSTRRFHFFGPSAPRLAADVFVVSLALVDRMLRQLEMGREPTLAEDRAAHAGAERQHDLEAAPRDDT